MSKHREAGKTMVVQEQAGEGTKDINAPDKRQERERQEEEAHLHQCMELIAQNVAKYEEQAEERHREVQHLYKLVQGGNVELYDQLFTAQSLEQHSQNQVNRNRSAQDKPFFGRIDYKNLDEHMVESIYIGKHGVQTDKTHIVIVDWRAPIATVYYENELGPGSYQIPDGREYQIDLNLKRTYDIEDGRLIGFYDSDVAANDELLVKYLSKNRDAVLGDIIATIQKEQNAIIRANPFHNIIVQGVAGSGKTTVAMHRISYIMYNYKERFTSNEFCIVGGSDILIDYITGGLPELDVYDVKHMRMDGLLTYLLRREWKKKFTLVQPEVSQAWKSKMLFARELEKNLAALRQHILGNCVVYDEDLGMLLSEKNNERFIGDNPQYSINQLMTALDERLRSRIKIQSQGHEIEDMAKKKQAQYKGYFSSHQYKGSVVTLYERFLESYGEAYYMDMTEVIAKIRKGSFDVYDVAAMVLIYYRVMQKKPDEEFGQILIDEAQDFGPIVYYVLRTVLPDCFFTIMGDVSQNVNYEFGMNDWRDMKEKIFCSEKDEFRILAKSYRNTIEISDFAGKILGKASKGAYRIEPVIRHGKPVQYMDNISGEEAAGIAADIIEQAKTQGYETIAVICFSTKEAEQVYQRLYEQVVSEGKGRIDNAGFTKGAKVLTVQETKGLEFDCVILWKPDLKGYEGNPKLAKQMYVAATRALHELYIMR